SSRSEAFRQVVEKDSFRRVVGLWGHCEAEALRDHRAMPFPMLFPFWALPRPPMFPHDGAAMRKVEVQKLPAFVVKRLPSGVPLGVKAVPALDVEGQAVHANEGAIVTPRSTPPAKVEEDLELIVEASDGTGIRGDRHFPQPFHPRFGVRELDEDD